MRNFVSFCNFFVFFLFWFQNNFVTLAACSRKRTQDIFAQILQTNSHLKKRSNEQNPNSCWSVRISADFIHKELGAVRSLSGDMAVVCAFSLCIGLVLIKPLTRVTNPEAKSKYGCSACAQRHRNPSRIKGIYKKVLNVQSPDWRCRTFCVYYQCFIFFGIGLVTTNTIIVIKGKIKF